MSAQCRSSIIMFDKENKRLCRDILLNLAVKCPALSCIGNYEQIISQIFVTNEGNSIYYDSLLDSFMFDNRTYCAIVRAFTLYDSCKIKYDEMTYNPNANKNPNTIGDIDARNVPEFTLVVNLSSTVAKNDFITCLTKLIEFLKATKYSAYPILRYCFPFDAGIHAAILDFPARTLANSFETACLFGMHIDKIFKDVLKVDYAGDNTDRYIRIFPGIFLGLSVFRPTIPHLHGSNKQIHSKRCSLYFDPTDTLYLTRNLKEDIVTFIEKSIDAKIIDNNSVHFDIKTTHIMPTYICNNIDMGYYDCRSFYDAGKTSNQTDTELDAIMDINSHESS